VTEPWHDAPGPDGPSRRQFLAGAGAAAATLVVAGCSSGKGPPATTTATSATGAATTLTSLPPPTTTTTVVRRAGDRPDPTKPEGADLLPQIEHIVVIMMENHSFDAYFGMLGRGDGFTVGADGRPTNSTTDASGKAVRAFRMANTCQLQRQPSNAWNATHTQWDNGAMDGFARSDSGPVAMGYWTRADLPFYYGLATTFPVCDRWFGSCMAQTFPNRRFLLAGTASGTINDDLKTLQNPPPPNGTIMDALNRHGISWKNYFTSLPTVGLYLGVFNANKDKVVKTQQFFTDAAAGTLPALSIVDPDFGQNSEENPKDITLGEAFSASVINAVLTSPAWPKTVLIWLYDEHGGYYDHVAPPAAMPPDDIKPVLGAGDMAGDYARYGLRVPAVVVSPFAKKNYVSHVVHDHTSILKFIETKFNLPALTNRDANADNLLDCLDLAGPPAFLSPPHLPAPRNGSSTPLCTSPGPIPNPLG
jgi:phospholipase C